MKLLFVVKDMLLCVFSTPKKLPRKRDIKKGGGIQKVISTRARSFARGARFGGPRFKDPHAPRARRAAIYKNTRARAHALLPPVSRPPLCPLLLLSFLLVLLSFCTRFYAGAASGFRYFSRHTAT
jgi:hypothetical protein